MPDSCGVDTPTVPAEELLISGPGSPLEEALRDNLAATTAELLEAKQQLRQANEELESRLAQRTEAFRGELNDHKQIEAQRKWLMKQLEQSNADLHQFTYTVSHDLKSPLVTILGFLGLLEKDAESGSVQRVLRSIKPIRLAAEQMVRMLNELLELSRIGKVSVTPTRVSVVEVAREAVDRLAGQINATNAEVVIRSDLPPTSAVRPQLVHMMQNLIGNAVKYMGDEVKPLVEVGFRRAGQEVIYYVRDNGIGIDPLHHEKIFGLFERMDHQPEGTGLGLAIVKRVAEVHGGRVWVESEEGKGSTFCFTLPGT